MTRALVSQILDSLQLRLRAIDVGRDPQVKEWIAKTRSFVDTGEINRRLEKQPDDPRDLIDRRRTSAS